MKLILWNDLALFWRVIIFENKKKDISKEGV